MKIVVCTLLAAVLILFSSTACDPNPKDGNAFPEGKAHLNWKYQGQYGISSSAKASLEDGKLYQVYSYDNSNDFGMLVLNALDGTLIEDIKTHRALRNVTPLEESPENFYGIDWDFIRPNRGVHSDRIMLHRINLDTKQSYYYLLPINGGNSFRARSDTISVVDGNLIWPSYGYSATIGEETSGGLFIIRDIDSYPLENGIEPTVEFFWKGNYLSYSNMVRYQGQGHDWLIFSGIDRTGDNDNDMTDRGKYQRIIAIDTQSGVEQWSIRADAAMGYQPGLFIDANKLYAFGQGMACLELPSGNITWQTHNKHGDNEGALFDGDIIYGAMPGNTSMIKERGDYILASFDKHNGTMIWGEQLTGTEMGMLPQKYGNKLFVPTANTLLVYEASTGRRLYRDDRIYGAPSGLEGKTIRDGNNMIVVSLDAIFSVDLSK